VTLNSVISSINSIAADAKLFARAVRVHRGV
jgi:hypothetical protein